MAHFGTFSHMTMTDDGAETLIVAATRQAVQDIQSRWTRQEDKHSAWTFLRYMLGEDRTQLQTLLSQAREGAHNDEGTGV